MGMDACLALANLNIRTPIFIFCIVNSALGLFVDPAHACMHPCIGLTSSNTFTVFLQLCIRVVKLDVVGEL